MNENLSEDRLTERPTGKLCLFHWNKPELSVGEWKRSVAQVRLASCACSSGSAGATGPGRVTLHAALAVLGRVTDRRPVSAVHRAEEVARPGRHHQPGGRGRVGESAAVRRRVDAVDAQAGHGRRQVQVGRDGAEGARVAAVWNVQVVAAWKTRLHHRLQAVHEQLRVVLVLRRLTCAANKHIDRSV